MNTNERIIIDGLIDSCQNIDARLFLPYLKNNSIKTNMPNKLKFYDFLEYMIRRMKESSVGNINYKIESVEWSKKIFQSIKFVDEVHSFPRLTILYEQQNKNLYLQIIPF